MPDVLFFEIAKTIVSSSLLLQAMVEDLLSNFPTTCILRVRMPISDDLSHRNFITKIVKYDRVVNVPNSMTCLTEMLPVSVIMAERKLTGKYGDKVFDRG